MEAAACQPLTRPAAHQTRGNLAPRRHAGTYRDRAPRITRGAVYKGQWGQYALWIYNEWYVDDTDTEKPILTDGSVIMCGPDMMGTRAFGQILDPAFNYAALPYAPKTWVTEDPAQRYIMMQSSPITIPSRVNAAFAATVCPPVCL